MSGPSSVVEAIAAGERAAAGMDRFLTGESHAEWRTYRQSGHVLRSGCGSGHGSQAEREAPSDCEAEGKFAEVEITLPCSAALRRGGDACAATTGKTAAATGRGSQIEMPSLTIDNKTIRCPTGRASWRRPAWRGIKIPSLCYLKNVQAIGACRVCLVEVEGAKTLMAFLRDHACAKG